jgi:hypothetical protein
MKYPEIPIAVYQAYPEGPNKYAAVCVINPTNLIANGSTEKEAIARLKQQLVMNIIVRHSSRIKQPHVKYDVISLENELVAEVMDE